jgi:hypothetical protein
MVEAGGGTLSVTRMDGRRIDRICFRPHREPGAGPAEDQPSGSAAVEHASAGAGASKYSAPKNGAPKNGSVGNGTARKSPTGHGPSKRGPSNHGKSGNGKSGNSGRT